MGGVESGWVECGVKSGEVESGLGGGGGWSREWVR